MSSKEQRVQPFKGLRFSEKAGSMEKWMAPPYDVIDDSYREELYQRSEYNICRISKSQEIEREELENHYQIASGEWERWRKEGILTQDEAPAYYFYEQEFEIQGQSYCRLGLVCAHKLVEFGAGVLPHEKTLSGPKEDRFRLLNQTKTHFGQIFGLYSDPEGKKDQVLRAICSRAEVLYEGKDDDGLVHRLKKTSNTEELKQITELLAGADMIIADGHHRYETALRYSKENSQLEASHLMMTVVSLANPGLQILPTHRLLKGLPEFDVENLLEKLSSSFDIHRLECDEMNKKEKQQELLNALTEKFKSGVKAFGLYSGGQEFILLTLKEGCGVEGSESTDYRNLDVAVLHQLILEKHLGIDAEKLAKESHVEYIKDTGDAVDRSLQKVDAGTHQAVFLMNPTTVEETEAVARNGEKMPQKSTFFYPKVFTGLVTYPVEEGVIQP